VRIQVQKVIGVAHLLQTVADRRYAGNSAVADGITVARGVQRGVITNRHSACYDTTYTTAVMATTAYSDAMISLAIQMHHFLRTSNFSSHSRVRPSVP